MGVDSACRQEAHDQSLPSLQSCDSFNGLHWFIPDQVVASPSAKQIKGAHFRTGYEFHPTKQGLNSQYVVSICQVLRNLVCDSNPSSLACASFDIPTMCLVASLKCDTHEWTRILPEGSIKHVFPLRTEESISISSTSNLQLSLQIQSTSP